MDVKKYWEDIDANLEKLMENGSVKLPTIRGFGLESLANDILHEMGPDTFREQCLSHKLFLEELAIHEYLLPKLFDIARNDLGFEGKLSNQYHIARKVAPGNYREMYRAHFDSHLFTLVLPIQIPTSKGGAAGELIYFPKARKKPKNEISNFLGKAYHKRFASKFGLENYSSNHPQMTEDFLDYEPLLFIGNTTLHTNKQVSLGCSDVRLTLLAHFFDPSPQYGIGGVLRMLRRR